MENRSLIFLILLIGLAFATPWYPDEFSIENIRLNATYPIVNGTYNCMVDTFTIGESGVLSATFEISGCGIDINSSNSDSIGSQHLTDLIVWNSTNFTPTSEGELRCDVIIIDEYGTTKTGTSFFRVGTGLGNCGDNDTCTITGATEIIPEKHYHYRSINVTAAGSLSQALTSAERIAWGGDNYYIYVDGNFTLSGSITLSGSGREASDNGVSAGSVYIYTNEDFVQPGTITGNGVSGLAGNDNRGGKGLNIYIEANKWIQSGALSINGENGGSGAIDSDRGGVGGGSGLITFKGKEWDATGAWTITAGDGGNGKEDDGGNSGSVEGIKVDGFLNRSSGATTIDTGNPGDARGGCCGDGGRGGEFYFLKTVKGRISWTSTGAFTVTIHVGGDADGGSGGARDGGHAASGMFINFNGTDFEWTKTISITLGKGGDGDGGTGGSDGGNGGSWLNSGVIVYNDMGMVCRDTCDITGTLTMLGGAKGLGDTGYDGSYGVNASWEVEYNKVSVANDFTKLLPERTTYDKSAVVGFEMNKSLGDTISFNISVHNSIFALQNFSLDWSSDNLESQTLYYDLREINGNTKEVKHFFQNSTETPSVLETNILLTHNISSNRYDDTTYTYQVREWEAVAYRFSDWQTVSVIVYHANSTANATREDMEADGGMDFTCDFEGFEFYDNNSQYVENESSELPIYFGTVYVYIEDNNTNTTYLMEYDQANDVYETTVIDTYTAGNHRWWCVGEKTNYQNATDEGTSFDIENFTVMLPSGISSVDIMCIFPTINNMIPIGQDASNPIFTIVNNNDTTNKNYSLSLTADPIGGSIYFNNVSIRTGEHLLNSTANLTICSAVPFGNTTACQIWLFADCLDATVVDSMDVSYYFGEEK